MVKLDSREEISKKQSEKKSFYLLPPDEDYVGYIGAIREIEQDVWGTKTGEKEKKLAVDLLLIKTFDDSPLVSDTDKEGKGGDEIAEGSMILTMYNINPKATGFMQDNPSKFRSLIAYSTGQNINGAIEYEGVEDFVGKYIGFNCKQYVKKDGNLSGKVSCFRKTPKSFEPTDEGIEKHKGMFEDVLAKIKERSAAKKVKESSETNKANEPEFIDVP